MKTFKTNTLGLWVSAGALVLGVGACAMDEGLRDEDFDDLAQGLGESIDNENDTAQLRVAGDVEALATGEIPEGLNASGERSFEGARGSVTYSYTVACFDAAGVALSACGPLTDRAEVESSWTGTVQTARYSGQAEGSASWVITGFSGDTLTINGTGGFEFNGRFQALGRPVTRTRFLKVDAVYIDVLVNRDAKTLVGGSIDYAVETTLERDGGLVDVNRAWQGDATVTFSGEPVVELVIDGTRAYQLNLESHTVAPAGAAE